MSYWRLVEASSGVDVDCVLNIIHGLRWLGGDWMGCPILSSRCEQKTAVGGECQSPEERRQSFVVIYVGIPDG